MMPYKKIIIGASVLAYSVSLTGCATTDQHFKYTGATAGGILGGLTALALKGNPLAIAGGVVAGALLGNFIEVEVGKAKERKERSAAQIYINKPELAKKRNADLPVSVSDVSVYLSNSRGKKIANVKNGGWVTLGMRYEVDIPRYSNTKAVMVTESHMLVSSDGKKIGSPKLTRTIARGCEKVRTEVPVKIPANIPSGSYTHHASISVDNVTYKKAQLLYISATGDYSEIYVYNYMHN